MKAKPVPLTTTDDGHDAVFVSFEEWSNVNSGQLRALLLGKAGTLKSWQLLEVIHRDRETGQSTLCRVTSVFAVSDRLMWLVSVQPVRHRQREINRRRALKDLNRAYNSIDLADNHRALRLMLHRLDRIEERLPSPYIYCTRTDANGKVQIVPEGVTLKGADEA